MSVVAMPDIAAPRPFAASLLPIMGAVFVAFLVIGVAMPVLPLYVHDGLGFGTFVVGLVAGSQFAASLISRPWAGHYSDGRGAKRAVFAGLLAASASGLIYLCSLLFRGAPGASVAVLLLGRGVLGGAESFIITAAVSWGLAIVDARNTGKVIAWVGSAMFAAFAIGAPVGSALYAGYGFAAIAAVTALAPLVTLLLIAPLPAVVPRGWTQGWLAYTAYAVAFILARVFFSHPSDKFGGAKVALFCVLIETAGQALMWLADRPELALVGAALTGFGFSLVYPGFGVEAVRRVPAQSRGLAMGAYTAFLDLAQGVASPALGLVAKVAGLNVVFLVSAVTVLCAAFVASWLMVNPPTIGGQQQ